MPCDALAIWSMTRWRTSCQVSTHTALSRFSGHHSHVVFSSRYIYSSSLIFSSAPFSYDFFPLHVFLPGRYQPQSAKRPLLVTAAGVSSPVFTSLHAIHDLSLTRFCYKRVARWPPPPNIAGYRTHHLTAAQYAAVLPVQLRPAMSLQTQDTDLLTSVTLLKPHA